MKLIRYILAAALSTAVFGAAAGAQWITEESVISIPDQIDEINIGEDGFITTAWHTYSVSMAEDIITRYEGPAYKYENGELREHAYLGFGRYVYRQA